MTGTLVLALTSGERTMWTILLIVGVIVLAVVVVLLQRLYTEVVRVDAGAKAVWSSATRLARNTATTWQLGRTAEALEAVTEEARRHAALLEEKR